MLYFPFPETTPKKGRKPSLTPEQVALLHQRLESGDYKTKRALAKEFGISAPTLYRYQ
ncbi:helix-turn-helix domain-containing protein [Acinetobacter ursingii]|nr:helix-turn-helix domain-containing protein [Acinetobacter ursingii]